MAEFPTVNFQTSGEGLFSADEIQRLMRAECDRATRYRYPVSCMLIGVDRLEQLGDLYGAESRVAILKEVERLLRGVTRESDFLGCLFDHRFLAMFPHTPRQAGPAMARRILAGARKLVFDEGHSSVQVTLSVGLTHRLPGEGEVVHFEDLLDEVRAAQSKASAAHGSQMVMYEPPPPPPEPPAPLPPQVVTVDVDVKKYSDQLDQLLKDKVHAIFAAEGQRLPDFHGHEQEVLELAMRKLETERERLVKEHQHEVSLLQRRMTKLSESLGIAEDELRRVIAMKGFDPGVASIYRTVQGMSTDTENRELKKEMMAAIFEANVELQKQLRVESD